MIARLLLTTLLISFNSISMAQDSSPAPAQDAPEEREHDVKEAIQRSRQARAQVAKDVPQRDVASMPSAKDQAFQKEFDNLMEKDDDQAWFDQVDKLVEQ